MKKYILLTSVLALAACGGGGGVSDEGNPRTPGDPVNRLRASDVIGESASDNNEITSMASAVVVANGYNYSSFARKASSPEQRNEYTIYRLNNVDFKLAGEGPDAIFNFEINPDGRIVKATGKGVEVARDTTDTSVFKGEVFQLIGIDGEDADGYTIVRSSETTQQDLDNMRNDYLNKKAEKLNRNLTDEEIANVTWDYMKQNWKFDTSKNYDEDLGLTYSDFGYFSTQNTEKRHNAGLNSNKEIDAGPDTGSTKEEIMLFAGGYDILPEATKPEKGAKFEGTAIGVIKTSIDADGAYYKDAYDHHQIGSGPGSYYNSTEMAKLKTTNARLEIDNDGNTKLSMPFGSAGTATDTFGNLNEGVQWYDVEVVSHADTNTPNAISFITPKDANNDDVTITTRFKHQGNTDAVTNINEGYYGVTTPVEATGTVVYREQHDITEAGQGDATRNFNFEAAYGMQPSKQ